MPHDLDRATREIQRMKSCGSRVREYLARIIDRGYARDKISEAKLGVVLGVVLHDVGYLKR